MLQSLSLQKLQPYLLALATGIVIGALNLLSPMVALGALIAISALILLLQSPVVACYIMALAIPVTAGILRGKLFPLLRPNELLLVVFFGFSIFILLTNKDRWSNLNKGAPFFLAFIVLAIGTIFIPLFYHQFERHPISIDAIMDVFAPVKYLLLFIVFLILPTKAEHWHKIIIAMLIGSSIVSLFGFLQAAQVGFALNIIENWYASEQTSLDVNEGGGRITSLMGAWNSLGMLLMAATAIGWASLQIPAMRKYRLIIIGSITLSFLCLLISGSFAGIGGLVLSILLIELLTSSIFDTLKRFLIAGLFGTVSFLVALPVIWDKIASRFLWQFNDGDKSLLPQTYVYRFWIWEDVFLPEIRRNPIFGTALEIYPSYRWMAYESQYILLLFRYGVIGLVAHLAWVFILLVWLFRQARQGDQLTKMMSITAFSFLIVLLITSYTNEVFQFTGIIDFLWILFALVANRKGSTAS